MKNENIFIFGVSGFSKTFFEITEFAFNVEGFIDNDIKKHGEKFCGKTIFGLDVLKNRNVKVIIVSSHYKAIIQQLQTIGYSNYECFMDFDCLVAKYPNEIKKYIDDIVIKIRCQSKENKVNAIILSMSAMPVYSEALIRAFNRYSTDINAIGLFPAISVPQFQPLIVEIFKNLGYYDCVDIHYLSDIFGECIEQIRANCGNLIVTIFGSDVYVEELNEKKKKVLNLADNIIFSNAKTIDFFTQKYGNQYIDKFRVCDFGLGAFDFIDELEKDHDELKKLFDIGSNKIVVMCGTNATPQMNHFSIIDKLSNLSPSVKDKLFLFIPVMYPKSTETGLYINKIKNRLEASGIEYYVTPNETISYREISKHRIITDVLIFVRDTDQLSGSMIESLYAGAIVLTGSWLPYEELIKKEMPIFTIDSLDDIEKGFLEILMLLEDKELIAKYRKNSKNVLEMEYKWKSCYRRWEDIYLHNHLKI